MLEFLKLSHRKICAMFDTAAKIAIYLQYSLRIAVKMAAAVNLDAFSCKILSRR